MKFIFLFLLFFQGLQGTLYLTWQHNPSTTMTVHWITTLDKVEDVVHYCRKGDTSWKAASGFHIPMPDKTPFFIHHVELFNLLPDTEYLFRTGGDGEMFKFRTMPYFPTTPIRFVVGGDLYHDELDILEKMNRQVASLNPMFVVLGGDLAYDDARMSRKRSRWLDFLTAWKNEMKTKEGRLIPIVAVVGNHELQGKKTREAPFFTALFYPKQEAGYRVLDFGNYLSLFLLNSDHTEPIQGRQTEWLHTALLERQAVKTKFCIYHVPAYPCVRKFEGKIPAKIRHYWVPLFEKGGVHAAFENHDHAYKRTWPLRQGQKDPKGILYLGDGGWGVKEPREPYTPQDRWYLSKTKKSRNAILVTLDGKERHFLAFDDDSHIIDEYIQQY